MGNTTPYAGGFLVKTPYLDQLSNRLYTEQQQRTLQQQQESKMLDNEFANNLSGIRDADIPDLTKAYGDYKNSWKGLYQKKGGGTPTEQLDVLRKKAAIYDIINKSKEQRQNVETPLRVGMAKNKNNYVDNAADMLKESMNTPINKLGLSKTIKGANGSPVDLSNPQTYVYTPTTDFSKDIKNAVGAAPRKLTEVDESTPGALQKTMATYTGFNSPTQTYTSLVNSLTDKRRQDDFIKTHQFSPIQEAQITDRYNSIINDPSFIKAYGTPDKHQFIGDDTEIGHAAKLATMLSTQLPTRTFTTPTDVAAKEAATLDRQKTMQTIRQEDRLKAQTHAAQLGFNMWQGKNTETVNQVNTAIDDNRQKVTNIFKDATDKDGNVSLPPSSIGISDPAKATNIRRTTDGNFVYDRVNNKGEVTESNVPLSGDAAARAYAAKNGIKVDYPKVITHQQKPGDKRPPLTNFIKH